jgi:hypothetical protein
MGKLTKCVRIDVPANIIYEALRSDYGRSEGLMEAHFTKEIPNTLLRAEYNYPKQKFTNVVEYGICPRGMSTEVTVNYEFS